MLVHARPQGYTVKITRREMEALLAALALYSEYSQDDPYTYPHSDTKALERVVVRWLKRAREE